MNFNGMAPGMGFVSGISIIAMIVAAVREVLLIILLFKGIQVASLYLKNNKDNRENTEL